MFYMKNFVVAIKCDGKILREQKDVVYLPFGKTYSILIKNLYSRKASVGVEIDDQDVLGGKRLIVDANCDVELERYIADLNKGNKFKFIEFTEDIEQYRGRKISDGIVRISFKFEKYVEPIQWSWTYYPSVTYKPCSTGTWYISSNNVNNCSSSSINYNNDYGITVPGDISEQKFQYGHINTLENEEHVITLQLKGYNKNIKISEPLLVNKKIKCLICGKLNKNYNKFCFNCGASLIIV